MGAIRRARAAAGLGLACTLSACVSMAEFRKLEYDVNRMKGGAAGGGSRAQVADAMSEIQSLREEMTALQGRIEVAEHQAAQALEEARAARTGGPVASRVGEPTPGPDVSGEVAPPGGEGGGESFEGSPEEVQAYRDARAAWRAGDLEACIDRFRDFLQTYPASDHADDAAYWMADCHYREGDYKAAVLRFADVVQRYPSGDKAPEALYKQGEALLRLGPKYGGAAETAFKRLIDEYPDSPLVADARRQLELLGPAEAGTANEG